MSFFEGAVLALMGLIYFSLLSTKAKHLAFQENTINSIGQIRFVLGAIEDRVKFISQVDGPQVYKIEDTLENIAHELDTNKSWTAAHHFGKQLEEIRHDLSGICAELSELRDIKVTLDHLETLASDFSAGYKTPEDD